jgi:pimeloyl-ACP methyl ester carboxylesterase
LTGHVTHVTIGDCRLEYRWLGSPAGEAPTIVFLHEGLGSITQWRDFPAALCERTGCSGLVYNRRGYGGSDAMDRLTPRFMHREALDVLPRVLDALGIERPVLFGHSDGGSIALIYAGSGLPPPSGLILEAAHVFVEDVTVARIAELPALYRAGELRRRLERHHGRNVDRLFDEWTRTWLSAEFRGWNIEECLHRIQCPALVIQGRDDEYGTLRQVEAITTAVRGATDTLVIEACGHAPHIDRREDVLVAAATFVQRLRMVTHG